MTKKAYFERTGKKPPSSMIHRGKDLAAANKKCEGTPNDDGQFHRCVEKTC
jgi:hypothetical protein